MPLHSFRYLSRFPLRYRSSAVLSAHRFRISDPWQKEFTFGRDATGVIRAVDPVASCSLELPERTVRLAVSRSRHPRLAEAVLELGRFLFASKRIDKYLTLFQAYEAIEPEPLLELSVVRHALTHAAAALSRPKTVAELRRLFGTTDVDLLDSHHQRVFYEQLARLLVTTESLLADKLAESLPEIFVLKDGEELLSEWALSR